jgi:hypothetical protein
MKNVSNLKTLIRKIYPLSIKGSIDFEIKFELFLKQNRLIHLYAIQNKHLSSYLTEWQTYQNNLKQALTNISKKIGSDNFVVIKTIPDFPQTTSDIDILVFNYKLIKKVSKVPTLLEIDAKDKISWTSTEEISKDFIKNNLKKIKHQGLTILVPNINLDILIRIAHIPFEQAEIRLGELLYIYKLAKNVD